MRQRRASTPRVQWDHTIASRRAGAGYSPNGDGDSDARHMGDIRVVLADDHAVFRQGLRQLLELEPDMHVVGDAATGFDAVRVVRELQPDVVLMDVNMPGIDGIAATRAILAEHASVAVIILTMFEEDEYAFQAIRAGARGYLLKTSCAKDVVEAVRVTHRGASSVDPALVPSLLREFHRLANNPGTPREERLSERDLSLLRMLVDGKSNKEIARHLVLAESTVKNNLSLLFQKLGARDRTQAAVFAISRGVLPSEP